MEATEPLVTFFVFFVSSPCPSWPKKPATKDTMFYPYEIGTCELVNSEFVNFLKDKNE